MQTSVELTVAVHRVKVTERERKCDLYVDPVQNCQRLSVASVRNGALHSVEPRDPRASIALSRPYTSYWFPGGPRDCCIVCPIDGPPSATCWNPEARFQSLAHISLQRSVSEFLS